MGVLQRGGRGPRPVRGHAAEPPPVGRAQHAGAFRPAGQLVVGPEPLLLRAARGPVHGVDQVEGRVAADVEESRLGSGGVCHAGKIAPVFGS